MSADLDRRVFRWAGRPQVGRFYGDFLCMASFRKNGGPLALKRWPRKLSFEIKRLSQGFGRELAPLKSQVNSRWACPKMRWLAANDSLSVCSFVDGGFRQVSRPVLGGLSVPFSFLTK